MAGYTTTDIAATTLADEVIVNRNGSTSRQRIELLARQIWARIGGPAYETTAELISDLAWSDGTLGTVWGDVGSGIYRHDGAAGSGVWVWIGDLPVGTASAARIADAVDGEAQERRDADAAIMAGSSQIFENTDAGISAVFDGGYFAVPDASGNGVIFYRRIGTAATEVTRLVADAVLSRAWAEGTLPGGVGTKSAKEHADDAGASAAAAAEYAPAYFDDVLAAISSTDAHADGDLVNTRTGEAFVANNTSGDLSTAGGAFLTHYHRRERRRDLTYYGAIENTDCTAAFDLALEAMFDYEGGITADFWTSTNPLRANGPALEIPAGRWIYDGAGFDRNLSGSGKGISIYGQGPNQSIIINKSDAFLITMADINAVTMRDFAHLGGKGLLVGKTTNNNVRYGMMLENLVIKGFSKCGIGHNSTDFPFIHMNHCNISGDGANAIYAVCLPGYTDDSVINNVTFGGARYLLRLGSGGVNAKVTNNAFFQKSYAAGRSADVWLTPVATENNAGHGLVIENNKFGNEAIDSSAIARIMVADVDAASGMYAWEQTHSEALSAGFVNMGVVAKNAFFLNDVGPDHVIYSTTPHIQPLLFTKDNRISGRSLPYVVEYSSDVVAAPYEAAPYNRKFYTGGGIEVAMGGATGGNHRLAMRPENLPGAHHLTAPDFACAFIGAPERIEPYISQADDPAFVPIWAGNISTMTFGDSTKTTGIDDPFGGTNAIRLTFGTSGGATSPEMRTLLSAAGAEPGQRGWMEVCVRRGPTNPASQMYIGAIWAGQYAPIANVMIDEPGWQLIRVPLVLGQWGFGANWSGISLGLNASFTNAGDTIDLYGPKFYLAKSPVNGGHLRTHGLNSGAWNGPHIVMGSTHMWVDSTGDLRVKSSAPTSDTDGTIVGSQS